MDGLPLYESAAIRAVTGPTIRPGSLELTDRALSLCRLEPEALVIDVGCGLGATVNHLRNQSFRAIGVDISPGMLETSRRTFPEESVVLGRADRLPLSDGTVAAVICECVLSLTGDPALGLNEFYRVLAPGGWLILSDIYLRNPGAPASRPGQEITCCLQGAVGKNPLLAALGQARFKTTFWEDHSDRLKQLAARIVWEYGSLSRFPQLFGPCGANGYAPSTKPGYFLLTAQKEAIV